MITKVYSSTVIGIESHLVTVETILHKAKKSRFHIVGMGDKAIQESKERIYAALESNNIFLREHEINVNLAPADLKKNGSLFDFPIAVSLLRSISAISISESFLDNTLMVGELSFDGALRGVHGVLSMAINAQAHGKNRVIVPYDNYAEASLIPDIEVVGVRSIQDFIRYLKDPKWKQLIPDKEIAEEKTTVDFTDVSGQRQAKRMLQIAAAGNHNMIMVGPPGSGKTMLAKCFPTIMTDMTQRQIIDTTRIYSSSSQISGNKLLIKRPFRSPHHGVSQAGMVGGGSPPKAGEISLAHNGVLFLDELTEFKRSAIEALRQPMEDGVITISRAQSSITLPAQFILMAALNPCPCGYLGDSKRNCNCSSLTIYSYLRKISSPFLDRIDLQIFLQTIELKEIRDKSSDLSSAEIRKTVVKARAIQSTRYKTKELCNGQLSANQIDHYCKLTENAQNILDFAFDKFQMSMRSYHKIIKVSRTIADLGEKDIIEEIHIKEALMYRAIEHKLTQLKSRM